MKMDKNLMLRIATAMLAIPITLGMIIGSAQTALVFCALLGILAWIELMNIQGIPFRSLHILPVILPVTFYTVLLYILQPEPGLILVWLQACILGILLISAIWALFSNNLKKPMQHLAITALGGVYVFSPFMLFYRLGFDFTGNFDYRILLGLLFLVWCSDTLAYITGRLLGKHKLMPSVSPGKTWEGAAGGFIFTLVLAYILEQQWPHRSFDWMVAGIIIGIFCPVGDLVESKLKRSLNLKDSGGLLPGHGGLLDRFDGFILSIPVLYIWLLLTDRLHIWLIN
jgi:phosphatidate cytidylyltransferase